MISQANHNKISCMPILRFCVLSRLLSSSPRMSPSYLFPFKHVTEGGFASEKRRGPPKGAIMHSAAFSCVSANAEQFSSVHYYIRNTMMLFHATSAESICTSISLLTAGQQMTQSVIAVIRWLREKKPSPAGVAMQRLDITKKWW